MDLLANFRRLFRRPRSKVGLALGGGGARGLAHLGVLQILQKSDIPIDIIVGTSMGAVVGGVYAQNPDMEITMSKVIQYLESRENDEESALWRVMNSSSGRLSRWANSLMQYYILTRNAKRSAILKEGTIQRMVSALYRDELIEDTKIPFAAVAVDILAGQIEVIKQGPIREAVKASAAIPGVFPPVRSDDRLLVDGGVCSMVPVEEALNFGAEVVIAVDVSKEWGKESEPMRGIDLLYRADNITRCHLKQYHLKKADLVIKPPVGNYEWFEFSHYQKIIGGGKKAAKKALGQVKQLTK